jgi:hypothetical protein
MFTFGHGHNPNMQPPKPLETYDYVLAPFSYHQGYLRQKQTQWHLHFQLLTKATLIEDVFGYVDQQTIIPHLMQAFDLEVSEVKAILQSLWHEPVAEQLEDPFYDKVVRVYRYLIQEGYLKKNPLGRLKYQGKTILVDGYHQEDPQLNTYFHALGMTVDYVPLQDYSLGQTIARFETVEDEVSAFFNRVASLLKSGVTIQDIYLIQPHVAYEEELIRQAHYFKIPVQLIGRETIFSLPIAQWYLTQFQLGNKLEAIWQLPHPFPEEDVALLKAVLGEYPLIEMSLRHQAHFLRYLFQNTRIKKPKYKAAVHVVSDLLPLPHQHVFVLGFAQGRYPAVTRDYRRLTPTTAKTLGLLTTKQENELAIQRIQQLLGRSKQIYLSFATLEQGVSMTISPLVTTWQIKEIKGELTVNQTDYSQQLGLVRKEKYQYLLSRFRYYHPYLDAYRAQFKEKISLFDYAYQPFDAGLKDKGMKLSYSAIKDFYQCSFKYYVGRVLKVKPMDQDEFYMHLGTFAHEIFEKVGDHLTEFDHLFQTLLEAQPSLSAKEKVLFRHLKDQLYQVCKFNALHQQKMGYVGTRAEEAIDIKLDEKTQLIGYIDKIIEMQDEKGKPYLAVVDYKSGSESFDEDVIPYGWSLQLPIYAWMLDHHPEFKGKGLLGVFIQHIIETSFGAKQIEINGETFPKSYQLDGIALKDFEKITILDHTIANKNPTFIAGVNFLKSGEFKKSRHLKSANDFSGYIAEAHRHLLTANEKIRQHDFSINPKEIKGKSSCAHCPFLDTCFRQQKDVELIQLTKDDQGDDSDADFN